MHCRCCWDPHPTLISLAEDSSFIMVIRDNTTINSEKLRNSIPCVLFRCQGMKKLSIFIPKFDPSDGTYFFPIVLLVWSNLALCFLIIFLKFLLGLTKGIWSSKPSIKEMTKLQLCITMFSCEKLCTVLTITRCPPIRSNNFHKIWVIDPKCLKMKYLSLWNFCLNWNHTRYVIRNVLSKGLY